MVVKIPEDEASSIEENTGRVESEHLVAVLQVQGVDGLHDQEHHHCPVHGLGEDDQYRVIIMMIYTE